MPLHTFFNRSTTYAAVIFIIGITFVPLCESHAQNKFYEYYEQGLASMDRQQYTTAISEFEKAIFLEPDDSPKKRIYGMRYIEYVPNQKIGIAYFEIGDVMKAGNYLRRSQEKNPSAVTLALLKKTGNDYRVAPVEENTAMPRNPKSVDANRNPTDDKNIKIETTPPVLSILELSLSKSSVSPSEPCQLSVTISNSGNSDAKGIFIDVASSVQGLVFPARTQVPVIIKNGGVQTVNIDITVSNDVPNSTARIDVKVVDPLFKIVKKANLLSLQIRENAKPKLVLAKVTILEPQSPEPNNKIDLNEIIDLKFTIVNAGAGDAENVSVQIDNNQQGIMPLGFVVGSRVVKKNPYFSRIASTKNEVVVYRYFVNSEFREKEIEISIKVFEKTNMYGLSEDTAFAVNTEIQQEGIISRVNSNPSGSQTIMAGYNLPAPSSDVDINIPELHRVNQDAVAVIIGNQNYSNKEVPPVEYAGNDARTLKKYLIDMMGFREGNIIFETNAALATFNTIFGTKENFKGKIFNYVKKGKSDLFIYYSGHGAPDPESKNGYFLPVDCDPSTVALNGYSLNVFYSNLAKIEYKSLVVIVDACFSGSSEKGMLLKRISPISISIDNPIKAEKNSIIITSASGDQVSSWYPEKTHSLFTYFFLKALRGEADTNTDTQVSLREMKEYLSEQVTYMARRLNNRDQNPQVYGDSKTMMIQYK